MGLTLVTSPTLEPVTRDEVKLHCRITDPSQDSRVDRFIMSARSYAENRLGRQLVNATWRMTLDRFPDTMGNTSGSSSVWSMPIISSWSDQRLIVLPRPPLSSVTWVKYYDLDNTLQTFSSANYTVDTDSQPGRIQLNYAVAWPFTRDRLNAVQIQFVAGFGGTAAFVPDDIKHAIEMLAAHYYEHREAVTETNNSIQMIPVPLAVDDLLDLHRVEMYLY